MNEYSVIHSIIGKLASEFIPRFGVATLSSTSSMYIAPLHKFASLVFARRMGAVQLAERERDSNPRYKLPRSASVSRPERRQPPDCDFRTDSRARMRQSCAPWLMWRIGFDGEGGIRTPRPARIQNPVLATMCKFKFRLGHQTRKGLKIPLRREFEPGRELREPYPW